MTTPESERWSYLWRSEATAAAAAAASVAALTAKWVQVGPRDRPRLWWDTVATHAAVLLAAATVSSPAFPPTSGDRPHSDAATLALGGHPERVALLVDVFLGGCSTGGTGGPNVSPAWFTCSHAVSADPAQLRARNTVVARAVSLAALNGLPVAALRLPPGTPFPEDLIDAVASGCTIASPIADSSTIDAAVGARATPEMSCESVLSGCSSHGKTGNRCSSSPTAVGAIATGPVPVTTPTGTGSSVPSSFAAYRVAAANAEAVPPCAAADADASLPRYRTGLRALAVGVPSRWEDGLDDAALHAAMARFGPTLQFCELSLPRVSAEGVGAALSLCEGLQALELAALPDAVAVVARLSRAVPDPATSPPRLRQPHRRFVDPTAAVSDDDAADDNASDNDDDDDVPLDRSTTLAWSPAAARASAAARLQHATGADSSDDDANDRADTPAGAVDGAATGRARDRNYWTRLFTAATGWECGSGSNGSAGSCAPSSAFGSGLAFRGTLHRLVLRSCFTCIRSPISGVDLGCFDDALLQWIGAHLSQTLRELALLGPAPAIAVPGSIDQRAGNGDGGPSVAAWRQLLQVMQSLRMLDVAPCHAAHLGAALELPGSGGAMSWSVLASTDSIGSAAASSARRRLVRRRMAYQALPVMVNPSPRRAATAVSATSPGGSRPPPVAPKTDTTLIQSLLALGASSTPVPSVGGEDGAILSSSGSPPGTPSTASPSRHVSFTASNHRSGSPPSASFASRGHSAAVVFPSQPHASRPVADRTLSSSPGAGALTPASPCRPQARPQIAPVYLSALCIPSAGCTDTALAAICQHLPLLAHLDLAGNTTVTGTALVANLPRLTRCRSLCLGGTPSSSVGTTQYPGTTLASARVGLLNDQCVARLLQTMPALESLDLRRNPGRAAVSATTPSPSLSASTSPLAIAGGRASPNSTLPFARAERGLTFSRAAFARAAVEESVLSSSAGGWDTHTYSASSATSGAVPPSAFFTLGSLLPTINNDTNVSGLAREPPLVRPLGRLPGNPSQQDRPHSPLPVLHLDPSTAVVPAGSDTAASAVSSSSDSTTTPTGGDVAAAAMAAAAAQQPAVGPAVVSELIAAPRLTHLDVSYCHGLTASSLETLCALCPQLRSLRLAHCGRLRLTDCAAVFFTPPAPPQDVERLRNRPPHVDIGDGVDNAPPNSATARPVPRLRKLRQLVDAARPDDPVEFFANTRVTVVRP